MGNEGTVENQRRRAIQLRELLTVGTCLYQNWTSPVYPTGSSSSLYLEELTQLQDQLPPFPKVAHQFIEEELGDRPKIYAELSLQPIAAASLEQVYREAKTGETVAVKFSARTYESITIDLYVLRQLAAWANKNIKRVRSDLVAI